jgi:DNA polymerase-3 subunit beta
MGEEKAKMQFSCDSSSFQRGVSVVQSIAQSKIANPIIENVLIDAEENQVLFTGTNLAQTVRCCIDAEVEQKGQIAVQSRFIGNLARELEKGRVEVSLMSNRLQILSGKGEYRVGAIPADEFPEFLPVTDGMELEFSSEAIRSSRVAALAEAGARKNLERLKGTALAAPARELSRYPVGW